MARPTSFDRDRLLEDAFALFWAQGFNRTSIADIARRQSLERASIYNAFGDKTGLFLAAYQHYSDRYLAAISEALARGDSLQQQLEDYCLISIDNFCDGEPPRSCPTTRGLMEIELWDEAGNPSPARLAFARVLTEIISRVEAAFTAASQRGEFSGDTRAAAEHIVTCVRGLVILERAFAPPEHLKRIALNSVALVVSQGFTGGLASRSGPDPAKLTPH